MKRHVVHCEGRDLRVAQGDSHPGDGACAAETGRQQDVVGGEVNGNEDDGGEKLGGQAGDYVLHRLALWCGCLGWSAILAGAGEGVRRRCTILRLAILWIA